MPAERRGQAIAVGVGSTGNGRSLTFNGRRQPSCDGTSRMTRECQVRICEGLEVQFLGPTRLLKQGNACGAKGAGHRRWDRGNRQREEPDDQRKAAAFKRWHEPDDARVSSPDL